MGHSYLIQLREDAIRATDTATGYREDLAQPIGEAIMSLIQTPFIEGQGHRTCQLGNHGNALTVIDDHHSSEKVLYLWSRGCLRKISALEPAEIKLVQQLVEDECIRRTPKIP